MNWLRPSTGFVSRLDYEKTPVMNGRVFRGQVSLWPRFGRCPRQTSSIATRSRIARSCKQAVISTHERKESQNRKLQGATSISFFSINSIHCSISTETCGLDQDERVSLGWLEGSCHWPMLAMPRMMLSTAGPSRTMNMLGKMNRTSGKMILTVVFAAFSSAS